jgi:hypothetical protein
LVPVDSELWTMLTIAQMSAIKMSRLRIVLNIVYSPCGSPAARRGDVPGTETITGRAVRAFLDEPADPFSGDERYGAENPEGHVWYLEQHARDVAPEDMRLPR